jgi:hypothetical protein
MRKGTIAALAGALLALGAVTADAAVLPSLTDATNAEVKRAAPDFTKRQIKRAAIRAFDSGAKPRKLRRSSPAWYTETKKGKKPQGEGDVAMAPVDAPLPGEIGIRPGSMMISPFICTMNFIFQKGSTLAIGTAGHCIDGNEPIVLLTLAPGGDNPVLVELGNVLLKRNAGIGKDYALVEIPPELHSWVFPTESVVGLRRVHREQPAAGCSLRARRRNRHGRHAARRHGLCARRRPDRRQGHRLGLGFRLDHLGRADQRRRLR